MQWEKQLVQNSDEKICMQNFGGEVSWKAPSHKPRRQKGNKKMHIVEEKCECDWSFEIAVDGINWRALVLTVFRFGHLLLMG
jgi:hypothetical protein